MERMLRQELEQLVASAAAYVGTGPGSMTVAQVLRLLGQGVMIPYGDVVSYNGRGILFAGDGGIGKTPLAIELEEHGAARLAQDSPIIYNDGMLRTYDVRGHPSGNGNCPPFTVLLKEQGMVPLTHLFFMEESEEQRITPCRIDDAIPILLNDIYREAPREITTFFGRKMLAPCAAWRIEKPLGYGGVFHKRQWNEQGAAEVAALAWDVKRIIEES